MRDSITLCSGERHRRCAVRFRTYPKFEELASKYVMADPRLSVSTKGKLQLNIAFKIPDAPL